MEDCFSYRNGHQQPSQVRVRFNSNTYSQPIPAQFLYEKGFINEITPIIPIDSIPLELRNLIERFGILSLKEVRSEVVKKGQDVVMQQLIRSNEQVQCPPNVQENLSDILYKLFTSIMCIIERTVLSFISFDSKNNEPIMWITAFDDSNRLGSPSFCWVKKQSNQFLFGSEHSYVMPSSSYLSHWAYHENNKYQQSFLLHFHGPFTVWFANFGKIKPGFARINKDIDTRSFKFGSTIFELTRDHRGIIQEEHGGWFIGTSPSEVLEKGFGLEEELELEYFQSFSRVPIIK